MRNLKILEIRKSLAHLQNVFNSFPKPFLWEKISDNKVTQETRKTLLWSNIFLQQGHEFKRHIEQRHLKGIISSLILHLTDSGYKRKNSQNHCRKCLHSVSGDLPFPAVPRPYPPTIAKGPQDSRTACQGGISVGGYSWEEGARKMICTSTLVGMSLWMWSAIHDIQATRLFDLFQSHSGSATLF